MMILVAAGWAVLLALGREAASVTGKLLLRLVTGATFYGFYWLIRWRRIVDTDAVEV